MVPGAMRTIEVSEETFEALKARVEDFGDTPDTVIQRLLTETAKGKPLLPLAALESGLGNDALRALVTSSRFQHLNGRGRYFEILKFLHDHKRAEFDKVTGLKFGKRVQIARDRETIDQSGKSTFPEPIPGTDYWVLTNLSNRSKRDVVFTVMRLLGYDEVDTRMAVNSIPDTLPERSSSSSSTGL
jgi:negative modulator of initiation of replication